MLRCKTHPTYKAVRRPTAPCFACWMMWWERNREEGAKEAVTMLDDDTQIPGWQALRDVIQERGRQDAKWGEQNHDPFCYLTVLGEEYGELCQAALHARFGGHAENDMRTEAIHTAAVALAIVECIDRGKWVWGQVDGRPAPPTWKPREISNHEIN